MDNDVLRPFIGQTVEMLVGGVWIEGHMTPIVKGVITLLPVGESKNFYGPTAFKTDVVQAIRQVKTTEKPPTTLKDAFAAVEEIRSSLEQVLPGNRFVKKDNP